MKELSYNHLVMNMPPRGTSRRQFLAQSGTVAAGLLLGADVAHAEQRAIKLRDLYEKDMSFSPFAENTKGQRIAVKGFMAPPLKAQSPFFVLTKRPMATCPFCNDGDEWPDDLVAVYAKRIVDVQPFNVALVVSGTLELGDYKDPDTGFVSRVRLVNATFKRG